jgi:hypothetical protein
MGSTVKPWIPSCGACGGRLIGWGRYRRSVRLGQERTAVVVRRRRCRECGRTAGALPSGVLHRRLDPVDVVGRIVTDAIRGEPTGEIAASTCVPARTVRDILARYRHHAPVLARDLLALTIAMGGHFSLAVEIPVAPEPGAAFALGAAWTEARRHGAQGETPWSWLADVSGRRVLGTNTSVPPMGIYARPGLIGGLVAGPNPSRPAPSGASRGPPGRVPPPLSARYSRSAAARLHRSLPVHLYRNRPDHHQTARLPTARR